MPPREDQPYGERLTEQEYEALAPMLKLHDLGKPEDQKLAEKMKPGELKRRELKRRVVEALRQEGTITHAAAAAGVSVMTVYRWRETDEDFAAAVTEWMHVDQVDELHTSLYRIATNPTDKTANASVRAAEFLLASLDRKRYGAHQTIDQTVNVNHIVQLSHDARQAIQQRQAEKLRELRVIDVEALPSP